MDPQESGQDHHLLAMATRDRAYERGRRRATRGRRETGVEIRSARVGAGISQRAAGRSVGMSHTTYGRIERGELPNVTIEQLALACSAVGLELSVRTYADGDPIRDAAHVRLLERFHRRLPPDAEWNTEVPLPIDGDRRAWDAVVLIARARVAVEAETRLGDIQALSRKVELKRRDSDIDVVILVVADTRHNRAVLAAHRESLRAAFPLDGREVMASLTLGQAPRASGIVLL